MIVQDLQGIKPMEELDRPMAFYSLVAVANPSYIGCDIILS